MVRKTYSKENYFGRIFEAEQKDIETKEENLKRTESEYEEFIENNSDEEDALSEFIQDDEKLDFKKITARAKNLAKEKETESDEYKILIKIVEYESSIKSQRKIIAELKKNLDDNCRKRYDTLTEEEIKDLLVNKKWCKTIAEGIQNLYTTVANHLTKRIVELHECYQDTLGALTKEVYEQEKLVAKHLEQMGFKV